MSSAQPSAVAAVRRSNQAYADQVSRRETLECGVAYFQDAWPRLAMCNFVSEVVLGEGDAVREVHDFYASRGLACDRWAPALGQAAADVEALLAPLGFERRERMALRFLETSHAAASENEVAAGACRILGARAMPRAYGAVVATRSRIQSAELAGALSAVQLERLNDPQYAAFVATWDDQPVGMAALFQVGEIGRLCDLFVVPEARGRGVGTALVRYLVRTAQRWALRPICAEIAVQARRSIALLERTGFVAEGTIAEFVRPGVAEDLA